VTSAEAFETTDVMTLSTTEFNRNLARALAHAEAGGVVRILNGSTGEVRCWISAQPPTVPLPADDAGQIKRHWLGLRRYAAARSNAAQGKGLALSLRASLKAAAGGRPLMPF